MWTAIALSRNSNTSLPLPNTVYHVSSLISNLLGVGCLVSPWCICIFSISVFKLVFPSYGSAFWNPTQSSKFFKDHVFIGIFGPTWIQTLQLYNLMNPLFFSLWARPFLEDRNTFYWLWSSSFRVWTQWFSGHVGRSKQKYCRKRQNGDCLSQDSIWSHRTRVTWESI